MQYSSHPTVIFFAGWSAHTVVGSGVVTVMDGSTIIGPDTPLATVSGQVISVIPSGIVIGDVTMACFSGTILSQATVSADGSYASSELIGGSIVSPGDKSKTADSNLGSTHLASPMDSAVETTETKLEVLFTGPGAFFSHCSMRCR